MWLIDQLAEQHISEAQKNGEFDNLPGSGRKLELDDDSHVPEALRAAYRLMKNAGFLPPELEIRREAIELHELLAGIDPHDEQYAQQSKRLTLLTIKLRQAGMSPNFLQGGYASRLHQRFRGEE
ncbi:DUF1992 domain-containing protein [Erwinia psidii]|uniref:DnaJ family domain-containing protein n=1 Tax=Erwinia psidii TaxID=69224 RepID=UPI00226BB26F|nr:DUF1992 domain-containing protein [Erwinia psidii]MCX8963332.1 DUF1992 domain-containing protein [Erwinia psidii]MCX8967199.1 DUF1992 domain-containing protein [Erwinia psidii]